MLRWASVVLLIGCGAEPVCDPAALEMRLAAAGAGDVVQVGDCVIVGTFEVHDGATLEGTTARSTIVADVDWPRPPVDPGLTPIVVRRGGTVRALRVTVDGNAAIRAEDGGAVVLEDLRIGVPSSGIGIGVQSVDSLVLSRVFIVGNIGTEEQARSVPFDARATGYATHGIAIFDVAEVRLTDVQTQGFARFGAMIVDSSTTWEGGDLSGSAGVGVMISGGSAGLEELSIRGLLPTGAPFPSYGLAIVDGADVHTEGLRVHENAGLGVFQDHADVEHVDLSVLDNSDVGLWSQSSGRFSITGDSRVTRNAIAGVLLASVESATLTNTVITETALGTTDVAGPGFDDVMLGDGLHLLGGSAALSSVVLRANARAQILVDLGGTTASAITLEDVAVNGTGEELGLVVQNGAFDDTFDDGVRRLGDTEANDAARSTDLETLAVAGPYQVPLPPLDLNGVVIPVD